MQRTGLAKTESSTPAIPGLSPWGSMINFLPYLVMTLSLLLTLFFWRQYDHSLTVRSQTFFNDRMEETINRFFNRMTDDEQVLRGSAGLFNASEHVTRDEWHRYANSLSLDKNYPGIQGLGFSEVVHPSGRDSHIKRLRKEGFSSYRIWPEGERALYTAIVYLEPFDWRNQRAFGYDMFSEPVRHEAMAKARDHGEATLTTPLFLVQETEKDRQRGMLLYMPVYGQGKPVATIEQRREALTGFVFSPIRIGVFLSAIYPKQPKDIGFQIYMDTESKADALLFDSVSDWGIPVPRDYRGELNASRTVQRFGRDWLFTFQSLPAFAKEQRKSQSRGYLIVGLTVSALLTVIAFMLRHAHKSALAAARALRESQERYRRISEDSPAYISTFLPDGTLTYANPALASDTGITQADLVGRNFFDFLLPEYQEPVRQLLNRLSPLNPTETHEVALYGPDRRILWHQWTNRAVFDEQGRITVIQAVGQDISGRKRAEEERARLEQQVLHAQKMESLGVLAGGIAHDFNNILMAIIGNADLSLMKLPPDSPVAQYLRNIEKAANRAAYLAKQMLAYSGKGRFMVEKIDLNRVIEELRHVLESTISGSATLELDLGMPLPPVEADSNQIRQILMNLVQNSSEAMGEGTGKIVIRTGSVHLDRENLQSVLLGEHMTEGNYVFLEVRDTGSGIEKEAAEKIFDPFFTTKFTGRGLGLAAVHGIVRGHKGGIRIHSEPGQGTSFKVLLPASEGSTGIAEPEPVDDGWHGEGKILLVDDEEAVRNVAQALLMELGYTPVLAGSAEEAISRFRESPELRAVILDLTMPQMDGEHCFRELQLLDPKVKVIMSSGFSEQDVVRKFAGKGLAGFIQKPYKLKGLREALRKVDDPATAQK